VDFLLEDPARGRCWLEVKNINRNYIAPYRCWIEVKGVTLSREKGLAEWPNSVSARGARHIRELAAKVREGDRAVVLFVVQRADCGSFDLAHDLDPPFAKAWREATNAGVESLGTVAETPVGGLQPGKVGLEPVMKLGATGEVNGCRLQAIDRNPPR